MRLLNFRGNHCNQAKVLAQDAFNCFVYMCLFGLGSTTKKMIRENFGPARHYLYNKPSLSLSPRQTFQSHKIQASPLSIRLQARQ